MSATDRQNRELRRQIAALMGIPLDSPAAEVLGRVQLVVQFADKWKRADGENQDLWRQLREARAEALAAETARAKTQEIANGMDARNRDRLEDERERWERVLPQLVEAAARGAIQGSK